MGFKQYFKAGLVAGNLLLAAAASAQAQQPVRAPAQSLPVLADAIKKTSDDAIAAFHTPGLAVGVVQNGKVVFSGGFGTRNMERGQPVDNETLFRIASTTKAFTSAALAILVDDGVLDWDDKVIDTLPEFRMADPWVTREFTIRDLLTHRSGLGLGAGDLMLWPEPSGFSRQEIIHNLRYLKPVSSFRSKYAYDNLLYIVAGEVVARASGTTWENFVQTKILDPLEMPCFAGEIKKADLKNVAIPYGFTDEKLTPVTRNKISGRITASQAAGGLVCNAKGMTIWMQTMLSGGVGPNGKRIFSKKQRDEMWKSQTILRVSSSEREYDNTHFKTYALGWRKDDVHGYEVISHTGTLSGFQAYVSLVPELDLGIVVLNNGSNYGARTSVMQSLLKAFMGQPKQDWVKIYKDRQERAAARKKPDASNDNWKGSGRVLRPLEDYMGTYRDNWFGKIDIYKAGNQ
ncbi:MAG TPA: serine hydrolase, partial [Hellea balneolensis]|nr:serine hydrolase [Hellea balneolensis]